MTPREHLLATANADYKTLSRETDTEVAFTEVDDTLYIDFEGSLSTRDWLYNFDMYYSLLGDFKAHRGILKKWDSVKYTIYGYILKNTEREKVVFRGFSQGGAMALIAHTDFPFKNTRAVCFATPAVLCRGLPDYIFENVTLYEISNDPVTWFFPGILGYKKYGNVVRIDNLPWYRRIIPDFSAHSPAGYLKWL